MTLLVTTSEVPSRRAAAAGPLSPLAASLRVDLDPLMAPAEIWLPREKARLTKSGGRCPRHGVLLDFDPWSPRRHRCPVCGESFGEEEHYRWWIMNYQLWLAERGVHAAALALLTRAGDCRALATRILERYADHYLAYPNRDNVLGPTRLFFSTYLESIWLLQVAVATSLLELDAPLGTLGDRVRDRVLAPSSALIAEYHEGDSNRQVWNAAALAAARRLLGDPQGFEQAMLGDTGVRGLLARGLLEDGTWYEGENYHLFAHRGLWYGVRMADVAGLTLPARERGGFAAGFVTPFLTALPDFTLPARRDAQYHVSLRQWRVAESCELGLAHAESDLLLTALGELYRPVPGLDDRETGRARSTAEAERNVPAARLTRASLGWKALLCAKPEIPTTTPPLPPWRPRSVHLAAQGFAVFRRDAGRAYVALDYGRRGGGHGHPDRLNLWLAHGAARLLEDVGTGSYVDPTLAWYRSTLAHNAPLLDGRGQPAVDGALVAYDERADGIGWVVAEFSPGPGQTLVRRLVVMPSYIIDQLEWRASSRLRVDLPLHVDADQVRPAAGAGERGDFGGHTESGAAWVTDAERLTGMPDAWRVELGTARVGTWTHATVPHEWWRLRAPGPPAYAGTSESPVRERRFLVRRATAARGIFTQVWSWTDDVADVVFGETIDVVLLSNVRHRHRALAECWHVEDGRDPAIRLDGRALSRASASARSPAAAGIAAPGFSDDSPSADPKARAAPDWSTAAAHEAGTTHLTDLSVPRLVGDQGWPFELGEAHYRRSESTWVEAGAPTATVSVSCPDGFLRVEIDVHKRDPTFAPPRDTNPLDNEHPDINSDGIQLYLRLPPSEAASSWLLVPEGESTSVRVTPRTGDAAAMPLSASWRRNSTGYHMSISLDSVPVVRDDGSVFLFDLVVNEISPDRDRRRGQLVLHGARGEWVYLRGDREAPDDMLVFSWHRHG